jgi:hypothetical protein
MSFFCQFSPFFFPPTHCHSTRATLTLQRLWRGHRARGAARRQVLRLLAFLLALLAYF